MAPSEVISLRKQEFAVPLEPNVATALSASAYGASRISFSLSTFSAYPIFKASAYGREVMR